MNTFVNQASQVPNALTANGAATLDTSSNSTTDLFFLIGASRNNPGQLDQIFTSALREEPDVAVRILLWARDVRGGAGERNVYRHLLVRLLASGFVSDVVKNKILSKTVEVGRWDDLLVALGTKSEDYVVEMINETLQKSLDAKVELEYVEKLTDDEFNIYYKSLNV